MSSSINNSKDISSPAAPGSSRFSNLWYFQGGLVFLVLIISSMSPIGDTDLWWQMAYGRYFLENSTLIPDHTIYSWTDSSVGTIYCAWLSEIILYFFYEIGQLPVLFLFRFFCLFLFITLFIIFCKRIHMFSNPFFWPICTFGLLLLLGGNKIKPELFTFVFFVLYVWIWWTIRTSDDRGYLYCYLFPLIMIIWVNSHGGFLFGFYFLILITIGILVNIILGSDFNISSIFRKHFYISIILSVFAIFITPYGINYPIYLFNRIFVGNSLKYDLARQVIEENISIFSHPSKGLLYHRLALFIITFLFLLYLIIRHAKPSNIKKTDWTICSQLLGFMAIYFVFNRTAYFLGAVFSFSAIFLLYQKPIKLSIKKRKVVALICTIIIFAFTGLSVYSFILHNPGFHFSAGPSSPIREARFIDKEYQGYKIGNTYTLGGYLLWALWPETKVFIDPRYFPFQNWIYEYFFAIEEGEIDEFIKKYPFQLWCVQYSEERFIKYFSKSREWTLVFYGDRAAVFAKKEIVRDRIKRKSDFGELREINIFQKFMVLHFSIGIADDYESARMILKNIEKSLIRVLIKEDINAHKLLIEGVEACQQKKYEKSIELLEKCRNYFDEDDRKPYYRRYLSASYLHLAHRAWKIKDENSTINYLQKTIDIDPDNKYALYDLGAMTYYRNEQNGKQYLNKFYQLAINEKEIPPILFDITKKMLNKTYKGRPILIYPQTY